MTLEIKLHAVLCLKGLINRKNISVRQEHGSTFTSPKTHLKSTFISKKSKVFSLFNVMLFHRPGGAKGYKS